VNKPEFQTLLQPDHVLCADGIGLPQSLIKILAVPSAEFSGAMIDVVKRAELFKNPFQLAEFADVTTGVRRIGDVCAYGEANFVRPMRVVTRCYEMAPRLQLFDKSGANRAITASN
jgi:transcriptional regulator of aromatic amino acid metabolism